MKNPLILLIGFYQKRISPHFPPRCRYYPTCSEYAKTAIERFGTARGLWLFTKRILRCNRLFKGGIDYVPEEFTFFRRR